jgi:hypothetical protein
MGRTRGGPGDAIASFDKDLACQAADSPGACAVRWNVKRLGRHVCSPRSAHLASAPPRPSGWTSGARVWNPSRICHGRSVIGRASRSRIGRSRNASRVWLRRLHARGVCAPGRATSGANFDSGGSEPRPFKNTVIRNRNGSSLSVKPTLPTALPKRFTTIGPGGGGARGMQRAESPHHAGRGDRTPVSPDPSDA